MSQKREPHPREMALARDLKELGLEWNVETGDWFCTDKVCHFVMRVERKNGKSLLYGTENECFEKGSVVWLPHLTTCRAWLMGHEWELLPGEDGANGVTVKAKRRHTDFQVEKTEPTELAAVFSVMLEVLEIVRSGWE